MNKRLLSVLSLLIAVPGCTDAVLTREPAGPEMEQGPDDPFTLPIGDLDVEQRQNVLTRRAIFLGNEMASRVFEDSMNAQLSRLGVVATFRDFPMTPSTPREAEIEGMDGGEVSPETPAGAEELPSASCAFAERLPAVDTAAVDCRRVARDAVSSAMTRAVQQLAEEPLAEAFLEDAQDPDAVRAWYQEAFYFGLESSPRFAVSALRAAALCDTQPTPEASAFERGARIGSAALIDAVRAKQSDTPRTVCDVDGAIVDPATNETLDRVDQLAHDNPLCPGFEPWDADQQRRLATASTELRAGIVEGVREGARLESARLVREWICEPPRMPSGGGGTGDPLVLDLDDDGLHVEPIAFGARFDFGGTGTVRTQWIYGDAFVVFDRDGDGAIEASELFGDVTVAEDGARADDGLAALALYDAPERGGNGDGVIDARDAIYPELSLWTDRDGDARADEGELHSFEQGEVARIDLRHARWFGGDGGEHVASDVWFSYRADR